MKTKLLAATVLIAASASAFAVDPKGPGPLGLIDNMAIPIFNIVPMGIFQDVYSFTLGNPGELFGNVVALNFVPYNILGLTVTLQDATFAVIGSDSSADTGFKFSNLASGNYALNVLGFANGDTGGYYAGVITAVPEPETYAMLLVGLAIVGFVAARRKTQG